MSSVPGPSSYDEITLKLRTDMPYVHQCVYDMKTSELQTVLEAVNHNKSGTKTILRKRVLNLLSKSFAKTKLLRQKIATVYLSRPPQTNDLQPQPVIVPHNQSRPQNQSENIFQQPLDYTQPDLNCSNNTQQPLLHPPSTPPKPFTFSVFVNLPFFKTKDTVMYPNFTEYIFDAATFSRHFYLSDNMKRSVSNSWSDDKQEYKVQVILRLALIESQDNTSERLPYNLEVSVNGRLCKLPTLNIPIKACVAPWRCNVPIDISQECDIKNRSHNMLHVSWSGEPNKYMVAIFIAEKLTWNELLMDLKKKPMRTSDNTKLLIKKSMENDNDLGVDSMFCSVKDPLSKTKMVLPARGKACLHLQCFDAIQYLQMNEQKQTWTCPLCKKKVKFENLEVDEFFLNVMKSPDLREECENIVLLKDGSWANNTPTSYVNVSETMSNNSQTSNHVEVFTLSSDSDDDYVPSAKCSKYNSPTLKELPIKSERINITNINDQTQTNNNSNEDTTHMFINNSTENDLVLDLSVKKNSIPTTSSVNQSDIILSDDSEEISPLEGTSRMFNHFNLPNTATTMNNMDWNFFNNKKNKHSENSKHKARPVLCTITLD